MGTRYNSHLSMKDQIFVFGEIWIDLNLAIIMFPLYFNRKLNGSLVLSKQLRSFIEYLGVI